LKKIFPPRSPKVIPGNDYGVTMQQSWLKYQIWGKGEKCWKSGIIWMDYYVNTFATTASP